MQSKQWKKRPLARAAAALWGLALFAALLLLMLGAFEDAAQAGASEGQRLLAESLSRAAVTCYAIEGAYPPSLDYLTAHYGVQVDSSRYAVFYTIFADNIMPEITVVAIAAQP